MGKATEYLVKRSQALPRTVDLYCQFISARQTYLATYIAVQLTPQYFRTLTQIHQPVNVVGAGMKFSRPGLTGIVQAKTVGLGLSSNFLTTCNQRYGDLISVGT
jgi:hypothetical protein